MKRLLLIVFVLLVAAAPASSQQYGWSISSSATSPDENNGAVQGGIFNLYLWLFCSSQGMAAAEFDLSVPPGMSVGAFIQQNGFLNAGGPTNLLISAGGCPVGPVVVGYWILLGTAPGNFCLVPSAANGHRVTYDCGLPPVAWPILMHGFGYGLPVTCYEPGFCTKDIATEPTTWGDVKSLYR